MAPKKERYFVVHLISTDSRYGPDSHFQVQVLDEYERGEHVGYFADPELPLVINGETIPKVVLYAALRQQPGKGDYVNKRGEGVLPGFYPESDEQD